MNELSLVLERDMPHAPEKIWRALTDGSLIAQWLMPNDFQPVVGHSFQFRAKPMPQWDGIVNCEVVRVDPPRELAYKWTVGGAVDSVVTFTLTPTEAGTHLRMEQTGFRSVEDGNYKGANYGWTRFLGQLEKVVAAA